MRIHQYRYSASRGLGAYYAALVTTGRTGTPTYSEAAVDFRRATTSAMSRT